MATYPAHSNLLDLITMISRTYKSETWTLKESVMIRLNMWERRTLRKNIWITYSTLNNQEIQELYKDLDIVVDIKKKKLEWQGDLMIEKNRALKKTFDIKPEGRRKVGRLRQVTGR